MIRAGAGRVAAATLALQFTFGLVFCWGVAAPHARLEAHWSPLVVGAVFSATPLGYGTGTVLGGRLADRLPPRRLCWIGLGLLGAGFAVAFSLPGPLTFLVCYGFVGLGLGGGIALAASLAAAVQVMPSRVGAVGGALTATYALAAVVQVPIVTRLTETLGWMGALRLAGVALWLMSAAALALMPPLAPPQRRRTGAQSLLGVFRRPRLWTGCLLELLITPLGTYAVVELVAFSLARGLGLGAATLALVTLAAGNAVGRILGGVASDRIGVDRVLFAILAFDLAAGLLFWRAPGAAAILAGAGLVGLALGGAAGVLSRMASEAAPDAPATAFGLGFAGYAAGALSGPLLGAALGMSPSTWALLTLPAVAGLVLLGVRVRLTAVSAPVVLAGTEGRGS